MLDARHPELELVQSHPDHAEVFLGWREDEVTLRFNPLVQLSLEDCRERLASEGKDLAEFELADAFRWFVRRGQEVVATVSVRDINRMMLVAEIAYTVAPERRAQGIGGAAVRLLIARLFERTRLRKLVAYVHVGNVASRKLLERLGFACEGILREHVLIQGRPVDQALYALLAHQWRG